jgi:RNA polymerase sigma factor (sigma-70 family)
MNHDRAAMSAQQAVTHDDGAEAFAGVQRRLFGIAFRVLGDWTEAEDIVQEVWLRWQAYDRTTVVNATAFLVTTTTRLAINSTQSARARRESYVGDWEPEPANSTVDPATRAVQSEDLAFGILLLLERLSCTERAAFVLREAFEYPYSKIAVVLQVSEMNARQLVSRACKNLHSTRQQSARSAEQRRLMGAFLEAARAGEFAALEELFVRGRHQSFDHVPAYRHHTH